MQKYASSVSLKDPSPTTRALIVFFSEQKGCHDGRIGLYVRYAMQTHDLYAKEHTGEYLETLV